MDKFPGKCMYPSERDKYCQRVVQLLRSSSSCLTDMVRRTIFLALSVNCNRAAADSVISIFQGRRHRQQLSGSVLIFTKTQSHRVCYHHLERESSNITCLSSRAVVVGCYSRCGSRLALDSKNSGSEVKSLKTADDVSVRNSYDINGICTQ